MGVSTPVYRQCAVCYTDFGLLTKYYQLSGIKLLEREW